MPSDLTRRGFLGTAATAAVLGSAATIAAAPSEAEHAAQPRPIKILGICCSPRKGKNTAAALSICLDAVAAVDGRIEVELIELAGRKIPGEVAAGVALEAGERDDFPALVPKLSAPVGGGDHPRHPGLLRQYVVALQGVSGSLHRVPQGQAAGQ